MRASPTTWASAACYAITSLLPLSAAAQDITAVLQNNGPADERLDIVIVAEGYQASEAACFFGTGTCPSGARADAADLLDAFWEVEPYTSFRDAINVRLLFRASLESGADKPPTSSANTAFDGTYNCAGTQRLICVDTGEVLSAVTDNFASNEADAVLVLVNDTEYGGSGGSVAVASRNQAASLIAVHELGHTLVNLADEYETAFPGFPVCGSSCPEANVTPVDDAGDTLPSAIKWNNWLSTTTLPTPETASFSDKVGLFEGGRYFATRIHRPKRNCLMRSLAANLPFCEVCTEAHAQGFFDFVSPINSAGTTPSQTPGNPEALAPCAERSLEVDTGIAVDPKIHWFVDNQLRAEDVTTFSFRAAELGDGNHTIRVEVSDNNPVIRDRVAGQEASQSWYYVVSGVGSGSGDGVCLVDGACFVSGSIPLDRPCLICDPDQSETSFSLREDHCLINGSCYADGAFLEGSCERCDVSRSTLSFSLLDRDLDGYGPISCGGDDCDDSDAQRAPNKLELGAGSAVCTDDVDNDCDGAADEADLGCTQCERDSECDDGLACNGVERCVDALCSAGTALDCDDGLSCTLDSCNDTLGACVNDRSACPPCITDADCIDSLFCNGQERCESGACVPGEAINCDDGDSCTVNSCDDTLDACIEELREDPSCEKNLNQITCECEVAGPGATPWASLLSLVLIAFLLRRRRAVAVARTRAPR